ncbi:MAG: hypothetical protein K2H18_06455, partial [Muribaculaceae bacterium]|nr:hypothetical protein [Muribaculaceae bacterium]
YNMKKIYFILVLAILGIIPAMGQEKGISPEKRKEFREYKMKFLAQEMGLKEESMKKFFEVYNQLSDDRFDIRKEMHIINKKIKTNTATDSDYATLNRLKEQDADIEKRYDGKFATFLTSKEIFKMKEAENVFRKKLHEMKEKKEKRK